LICRTAFVLYLIWFITEIYTYIISIVKAEYKIHQATQMAEAL
jgi:hypothetical protein